MLIRNYYIYLLLFINTLTYGGFYIEPASLVHPLRFDLMAKYIYAKHRELGVEKSFAQDLYAAHLLSMNGGFYEGNPVKNSLNDFLDSFHLILDDIKYNGYQKYKCASLPIGAKTSNKNPDRLYYCDGSHRTSACLLYKKSIFIDHVESTGFLPPYNYKLFRRKNLDQKYMDAMALQYCKLSKKCFLAFLFPRCNKNIDEICNLLGGDEKIVYTKNIYFPDIHGQMNLLDQLYGGYNIHSSGAMSYWKEYFPKGYQGNLKVILFESDSLESVVKMKKNIREVTDCHYSIHITDDSDETLHIAKLVFVENSLHFLNKRKFGLQENLEKFISIYKRFLGDNKVDEDCFCIDGSAIMSAYGLRDCRDLDFLHHGYDELLDQLEGDDISSHNCEMSHHVKPKDDIIFNSDNFFYYKGLKFGALHIVESMKTKRSEIPKDINDLNLIKDVKC